MKHFIIAVLTFSVAAMGTKAQVITQAADSAAVKTALTEYARSDYFRLVTEADKAVAASDWQTAINKLQQAMTSDPSNPQNVMLLQNVGMMQFYAGNDSIALHTLTQARAMAPTSPTIVTNRARVLSAMGRPEDALRDYDIALEIDSLYIQALQGRAITRYQLGRTEGAMVDAARVLQHLPDDTEAKLLTAMIHASEGRHDEAISLYSELIDAAPEAVYYSARALCRLMTDDLTGASDDISRGLELDPDDPELYFCRAWLNRRRYLHDDAKADARRALALGLNPARLQLLP